MATGLPPVFRQATASYRRLPLADAGLYRWPLRAIWTLAICCAIPLAGLGFLSQTMDFEKNWILNNWIIIHQLFVMFLQV